MGNACCCSKQHQNYFNGRPITLDIANDDYLLEDQHNQFSQLFITHEKRLMKNTNKLNCKSCKMPTKPLE